MKEIILQPEIKISAEYAAQRLNCRVEDTEKMFDDIQFVRDIAERVNVAIKNAALDGLREGYARLKA